jgi:hypothetical protein
MNNKERNLIKKKILKCLTEDFKGNQHIFDKQSGYQVYNGTDLDMVMSSVVKGLEMAKHELNKKMDNCGGGYIGEVLQLVK